MRVKERWRINQFLRSCRKRVLVQDREGRCEWRTAPADPAFICQVPVAMADLREYPGASRRMLAAVYAQDGKAIVKPSSLRCGILVVDWSKWMRYVRQHRLI